MAGHLPGMDPGRVRIPIVGLSCVAGDRIPLERALTSVQGVLEAYVNAADDSVYLDVDAADFRIEEASAVLERFGARSFGPTLPAMTQPPKLLRRP